jgi:uncharacterized membrane protein YfcA
MLIAATPYWGQILLFFVSGVCGGVANSIAGGGSFFTFPAMLIAGIPALGANISSSIATLGGYGGGLREFRHEIAGYRRLLVRLAPVCVAGTVAGAEILLTSPPTTFRVVVPWLVGVSTVAYALAPRWAKMAQTHPATGPRVSARLVVGVFMLSVYGGYFGSGVGIMLLALLALTVGGDLRASQGIRLTLAFMMNCVTTIIFVNHGSLYVAAITYAGVGMALGGVLGALVISRLSAVAARRVIIAIGTATTLRLAIG